MDISLSEVLKPTPGHELWDIAVYVIFVIGLLGVIFLGEEGSTMDTMFVSAAVFIAVLDKVYAWGYITTPSGYEAQAAAGIPIDRVIRVNAHVTHFGTFAMRVIMFVLPLVVVGQTDSTRVRGIAFLVAVIGAIYTFARWFFEIRESGGATGLGLIVSEPQSIYQGSLFLLMAGELVCCSYWRRFRGVNWGDPLHIRRMLPTDNIKEEIT